MPRTIGACARTARCRGSGAGGAAREKGALARGRRARLPRWARATALQQLQQQRTEKRQRWHDVWCVRKADAGGEGRVRVSRGADRHGTGAALRGLALQSVCLRSQRRACVSPSQNVVSARTVRHVAAQAAQTRPGVACGFGRKGRFAETLPASSPPGSQRLPQPHCLRHNLADVCRRV